MKVLVERWIPTMTRQRSKCANVTLEKPVFAGARAYMHGGFMSITKYLFFKLK